ncbi:MAG: hypothetical protein JNL66_19670 [Alphaproteobacteria bacterium]|nr:hypothetical protein [Alphaproteobacteria bacterium]
MASFLIGSLFEEVRAYRRFLEAHICMPLRIELNQGAAAPANSPLLAGKLTAVIFKISLLDRLIELFQHYSPSEAAADHRSSAAVEIERRLAFIPATYLLLSTDNLRHRDRLIVPADTVTIARQFDRFYPLWTKTVAPAVAAFWRSPDMNADIDLRAALDDFIFQVVKARPATPTTTWSDHLRGGHAA